MSEQLAAIEKENESAKLQGKIGQKQTLIDHLLVLTEAINQNYSAQDIFDLYNSSLRDQFSYTRIKFLFSNHGEWMVYDKDQYIPYVSNAVIEQLIPHKKIAFLDKKLGENFDLVIPVIHKNEPLAFVLVDGVFNMDNDSLEEEMRFLQAYTNITVIAMENKRLFKDRMEEETEKTELEIAAKVQQTLIPSEFPKSDQFCFASKYIPYKGVGGDYFDVIAHPKENSIFFCIADVAGKGVSAAIVMANFQANLRAMINGDIDSTNFFQKLNKKVFEVTQGERFISLLICKLNFQSKKLLYMNAGHEPAIYKSASGITLLNKGSTLLGVFEKLPSIEVQELPLEPNSFVFLFTDGLTDLMNEHDEAFSIDRVIDFIEKNDFDSPEQVNDSMLTHINSFRGRNDFNDDISILTCHIKGDHKPTTKDV